MTTAPNDADALRGLGLSLLRAGKRDEAREQLAAALRIAPENQELRDALAQAGGRP